MAFTQVEVSWKQHGKLKIRKFKSDSKALEFVALLLKYIDVEDITINREDKEAAWEQIRIELNNLSK